MWYPLPLRSEFFEYQNTTNTWRPLQSFRSWLQPPTDHMKDVCAHLQKRKWIRKYVPWIKSVYLCDEISFNAHQEHLPIQFFIITYKKQLWLGIISFAMIAFLVNLVSKLLWKKRHWQLSMCVDDHHQDLSHWVFTDTDPYLIYWLAHLVPYYHEDFTLQDACIEKNSWITYYLPNYPLRQTIFLPIETMIWSSVFKRVMAKIGETWLFVIINTLIYSIVLLYARCRKKEQWVKKYALSSYITQIDKRKWYALQRELAKKVSY